MAQCPAFVFVLARESGLRRGRARPPVHFGLPLATLAPALVSLVRVPGGADLFGIPRQVA
ncbi:hypothetical protein HPC49_32545 [Pyxidicoccus fallax]|uniref:Uncharacterized protein n=1 Tax=Pyxidicoccus fallax TaxID=394095 RepID=A0A848LC32_9BACT|nr:hypothetical protein [Pyxidicoccus fallax]NMO16227.1 hypothetical protein [Pyxidicoccus fallax]NPC82940.1 hypothetical protein [Pyxidicoccus fallax]